MIDLIVRFQTLRDAVIDRRFWSIWLAALGMLTIWLLFQIWSVYVLETRYIHKRIEEVGLWIWLVMLLSTPLILVSYLIVPQLPGQKSKSGPSQRRSLKDWSKPAHVSKKRLVARRMAAKWKLALVI